FARHALCFHLRQQFGEAGELAAQVACVNADGDALDIVVFFAQLRGQRRQQAQRQVVDTVEAQVFQCLQCGGLARSGAAAEDQQFHAAVSRERRTAAADDIRQSGYQEASCSSASESTAVR